MNPVEEDRALDGEEPALSNARGRAAMDPTTRHLLWIASGIGLLLVVLLGGWALSGRRPSSIPVIEAQAGPVRVKPVNPGGMQALGTSLPTGPIGTGHDTLAPSPETARPDALKAEVNAAQRANQQDDAVPTQPQPTPAPQTVGKQDTPADHDLLRTENAVGPLAVQLAALDSPGDVQREWSRLSHAHPALFSGRRPMVEQSDHDGHTIYRLRMRGFVSASAAASFCRRAHAQGVACAVADF